MTEQSGLASSLLMVLASRDGALGQAAAQAALWGREAALRRLDDPVERAAFGAEAPC
ncbi:hypothetical protein [Brevundimonas guildfordensis]|uniref:Uncharacterized protein n=1 Tax=Brevundimonas guildfordensis TaxID=2762241 RepID=A0ABR8R0T5_9CAUL|nr:hypothetical protein [Brevundimonas guildfordensis]MBD7941373.1 hypothetical protein [Brevundimonas guildfordensis]